jgi:hypothetical protein
VKKSEDIERELGRNAKKISKTGRQRRKEERHE